MTSFLHVRRKWVSRLGDGWAAVCLVILLLLPLTIGGGLLIRSLPLLHEFSLRHLLLGKEWSPMEHHFGFYPFIISSVWVTVLAFIIAAPVCLLAAIYLTQYAKPRLLDIMHLVIDVLAGIPSVVYGVWGVLVIVPFVSKYANHFFHTSITGYSLLTGGMVLAMMSIPYMLNMLIEVFRSIPIQLSEVSLSLGATKWETIKWVLFKQGFSGIVAAMALGISKALGETIAVLMVVGNVVQIPHSIFQSGYLLPALIANNYGDMMSIPLYESALMFSGLLLFIIILVFNAISNRLIYKNKRA